MKVEVQQNQNRTSLIFVPNPFVVPGGRFREFYYWYFSLFMMLIVIIDDNVIDNLKASL